MSTRYVVLVKPPDDHPSALRVFGTFIEKDNALAFRDHVRAAVEASPQDISDEATGYAYLVRIEKPHLRNAKRWAITGEEVAS